MATSDAQKKAVHKYQQKLKRIPLDVHPDFYNLIKRTANEKGYSVNYFIRMAISNYLYADMCKKGDDSNDRIED